MSRNRLRAGLLVGLLLLALTPTTTAQPASLPTPEQVRLTLGKDPGQLVVTWSVVGQDYAAAEQPRVLWTPQGGAEKSTPATKAGTILSGGAPAQQALAIHSYVWSATLTPVEPGQKITFRAGSEQRGYTKTFTTALPPSDSLVFVAYGDIGTDATGPDGQKDTTKTSFPAFDVRDLAIAQSPDLVIIPGDLPYGSSRDRWDRFLRFMEPLQAIVPTMSVIGNHEWDENEALGYDQFLNAYVLPNDEHDYVFRAGPVTFIGMNSDRICNNHERTRYGSPPRPCDDGKEGTPREESLRFLEDALKAAQADDTPWTVVFHHHPPFSHGRHGNDWGLQNLWVPLYEKYGVDLVVAAHDHLYSRSHPILERAPTIRDTNAYTKGSGPIHVVTGGGGRSLYRITSDPAPAWHAAGLSIHHITRFDVNATTLRVQAIDIHNKTAFDAFTVHAAGPATEPESPTTSGAPFLLVLSVLAAALVASRRRRT